MRLKVLNNKSEHNSHFLLLKCINCRFKFQKEAQEGPDYILYVYLTRISVYLNKVLRSTTIYGVKPTGKIEKELCF